MGDKHGQLCQRRRVLSLQLLCLAGRGQDPARGYIRSWMPSHGGGAAVCHLPAEEEDTKDAPYQDVVSKVDTAASPGVSQTARQPVSQSVSESIQVKDRFLHARCPNQLSPHCTVHVGVTNDGVSRLTASIVSLAKYQAAVQPI